MITTVKRNKSEIRLVKPLEYTTMEKACSNIDNISDFTGNIITTHRRLLYMDLNSENIRNHEIIIDEDIFLTLFESLSASFDNIKTIINSKVLDQASVNLLTQIIQSSGFINNAKQALCMKNIDLDKIKSVKGITSNVLDILISKVLYVDDNKVYYIKQNNLNRRKVVLLSATVNIDLYRIMLKYQNIIGYECKKVKNKGRIELYSNFSYSRYALSTINDAIDFAKRNSAGMHIITFKSYEIEFQTRFHFGNVEGLNCLEGRDIAVIGLPNYPEYYYLLIGMLCGIDPETNKGMYPQKIEYNGYEFTLQTFKDKTLQMIQLYILNTSLEQAIGRARLGSHDCTVKVFARFPVDQAEIMK